MSNYPLLLPLPLWTGCPAPDLSHLILCTWSVCCVQCALIAVADSRCLSHANFALALLSPHGSYTQCIDCCLTRYCFRRDSRLTEVNISLVIDFKRDDSSNTLCVLRRSRPLLHMVALCDIDCFRRDIHLRAQGDHSQQDQSHREDGACLHRPQVLITLSIMFYRLSVLKWIPVFTIYVNYG